MGSAGLTGLRPAPYGAPGFTSAARGTRAAHKRFPAWSVSSSVSWSVMARDTQGEGRHGSDPHPDDFDERLERAREGARPGAVSAAPSLLGLAFRLATELVAGVAVGFLIGWLLDRWLGTAPWLTLAFFALGVAAGFTNVVRTARQMNAQSGAGTPAPPLSDEDDEG